MTQARASFRRRQALILTLLLGILPLLCLDGPGPALAAGVTKAGRKSIPPSAPPSPLRSQSIFRARTAARK